jgi:phosphate-selective porin OprO/OprP
MHRVVKTYRHHIWITLLAGGLICSSAGSAAQEESTYDKIWRHATLYESKGDSFIRSFALSGRLQADAAWFDADQGDYDDVEWRRFRFGFKSKFAGDWVAQLEGDFDLNESTGDWYNRLTDAYIGWQPDKARDLRILKHSAGFTLDGATSSKKLLTTQRSNLTNNLWFTAEYFTGISLAGTVDDRWSYKAGVFSGDGDDEISISDGSYFVLTSLGYDWARELDMKRAKVRLDYVNNDKDPDNNTRDFSDVLTLASQWEQGPWGLWTDLSAGKGYFDQSDVWGLSLMPFYNTSELVQWVLRYTYIESDEPNGVRLGRYHGEIEAGRGDKYSEIYAGINLFFYGHKLKWQTGLEYATLDDDADDGGDHDGWGITTGLRIYW